MKVQELDLNKITVGDRFRVDIGDLSSLIASIKEKGIIQPITVSDKHELIAGGRRLMAAKEVGLKTITAVIRKIDGELDAREIELLENVARKDMNWSERAKLEQRIFDLKKEKDPNWSIRKQADATDADKSGIYIRLKIADMLDVVPELVECQTQDEAWKMLKKLEEEVVVESLISKGELSDAAKWANDHYMIGDALKGMKECGCDLVGFAEVDPPYAIMLDKRKSRNIDQDTADRYNEISAEEYPEFLRVMSKEVYRILKDSTFCIWWFGFEWYQTVRTILEEAGFKVSSVPAIWVKGGPGQTASPDTMLGSSYEAFFVCRKGNPALRKAGRSNVFSFSAVAGAKKIHATERPVELMQELLNTFAYPGMTVLIPFLGSGVTLRASYREGLVGFGYDLDETIKRRFLSGIEEDQNGGEKMDDTQKCV